MDNLQKAAVRILIAHTGEDLASQDVNEILDYAWDGRIPKNIKVTSHHLTSTAWASDEQFAIAWTMWQQMLQHKNGEHPYWEDYKTHAYKGTIVRTKQRFYIEIYYKDFQKNKQKSTVIKTSEKQPVLQTTNAGQKVVKCSKCGRTLTQHEPDAFSAMIGDTWFGTICTSCSLVFCEKCLDAGGSAPCPKCGKKVIPAIASYLPDKS